MQFNRAIFCIVLLLSGSYRADAQGTTPEKLVKLKPTPIGRQKTAPHPGIIYLPMSFNSSEWKDTSALSDISNPDLIYAVHLVYTRFREVDSFNQPLLNLKRFKRLQLLYPPAFSAPGIEWKAVEQQAATKKDDAATYFHGFIIYLKNSPPKENMDKEIGMIKKILDSYHDSTYWVPEKIEWKVKRTKIATGKYLPGSKKKQKQGIKYSNSFLGFREPEYTYRKDSTIKRKSGGYFVKIGKFDTVNFRNINEFNLLTRRKWSGKTSVVTDVTGSMSPYATQVMLWLKYNPAVLNNRRFIFFNDGDGKPDPLKRTGSTGGIHTGATSDFDSLMLVMETAMRMGSGGDIPENNLEAVLHAIKQWPDTDTVLLIADNDAPVKDISLLEKVNKPVSVMVCGSSEVIHPDYVKIARTTGGRLFALNAELGNLKSLQNGSIVYFGSKKFEYKDGSLVRKRN